MDARDQRVSDLGRAVGPLALSFRRLALRADRAASGAQNPGAFLPVPSGLFWCGHVPAALAPWYRGAGYGLLLGLAGCTIPAGPSLFSVLYFPELVDGVRGDVAGELAQAANDGRDGSRSHRDHEHVIS